MSQILLAFGAGLATAASPCILPMLPLVLGSSVVSAPSVGGQQQAGTSRTASTLLSWSRHRPLLIVAGFVLSFASAAVLLGASTRLLGLSAEVLRHGALAVMMAAGLLLLWPALLDAAMRPFGGLADLSQRLVGRRTGAAGAVLLGVSLGLLWTPCAGPILASALALVATETQLPTAFAVLCAFAAGAGVPMLAVAYGGQAVLQRARRLTAHTGRMRQGFGVVMVAASLAIATGWEAAAAAWVDRTASSVWKAASAVLVPDALADERAVPADVARKPDEKAPAFSGLGPWFNSKPLSLSDLRGRVVLVDFWTHGCVNCLNTLPHLKRWHERYQSQGLVVIGVHSPEFAFERDPKRVEAAVRRLGIPYPVAMDNAFSTWTGWGVAAWPTLFLVDRQGRVVFQHVGEGDEVRIEAEIREALARP